MISESSKLLSELSPSSYLSVSVTTLIPPAAVDWDALGVGVMGFVPKRTARENGDGDRAAVAADAEADVSVAAVLAGAGAAICNAI